MDPITTTAGAANPQLAAIVSNVPMPAGQPAMPNGTSFSLSPNREVTIGGESIQPFTVTTTAYSQQSQQPPLPPGVTGGGDTTPPAGAQPTQPSGTTTGATSPSSAATTTTSTGATATTGSTAAANGEVQSSAAPVSGFGKAERTKPMVAGVNGATFSFPSFVESAKSTSAPAISWGSGWTRVEKNGMWYMEHENGTKAVPAIEYRVTPRPADKVQTVKVADGWGKRFPDGTVLVFDRTQKPYILDSKGAKREVGLGTHTFGGVKVRIFEASVVRTLEPNGAVRVFDSRGNASAGTNRRAGAALGAATAGAVGGGAPGKAPEKTSGGGGATQPTSLIDDIEKLTSITRGILDQVRAGTVDSAKLNELLAQLKGLPAGISQAAAGLGSLTAVAGAGTSTGAGTSGSAVRTARSLDAGAAAADAPTLTEAMLPSGISFGVDPALVPTKLAGHQARFGQLAPELQEAIAKAFGSTQGAAAFKADQLLSFGADGKVNLAQGGTIYRAARRTVSGGGPGSDLAMSIRPGRQPGAPIPSTPDAIGGGDTTVKPVQPLRRGETEIELYKPGGELQHVGLGGLDGAYTWQSLPPKAKDAIMAYLRTSASDPASVAFNSRTGEGWAMDPSTRIVIVAGFAQFVNGLTLRRSTTTPATPSVPPIAPMPTASHTGHSH